MRQKEVISVRVPERIKELIEKAAQDDRRPVANLVSIILEDWLRAKGYIKDDKRR
jgi:hypothetical protein